MSKIYFIVLDGAADYKIQALNNRTPLEMAYTPAMDRLAEHGIMSMIEILPKEYVPETDSGLMALLGYDPIKYYCGRGTLEAMGRGLYKEYRHFVGFRVNFASYNDKKAVLERRTARGLSFEELRILTDEILKNVKLNKYPKVNYDLVSFGIHRGILSFYSNEVELSGNVSNTDPGFVKNGYFSIPVDKYENKVLSCIPLDDKKSSNITATIVNDFIKQSHEVLEGSDINRIRKERSLLPCNWLILRDGGSLAIQMDSFFRKYRRKLAIYGELPCEKALAELIGADFCYSQEFSLQLNNEYLFHLADKLVNEDSDIVFCHLKGPDDPGHDHDPVGKVQAIEKIDKYFMSRIVKAKSEDDIVVVTCDHATPCALGIHSNDKVPLLISSNNIVADGMLHFCEENAAIGSCPVLKAVDIMEYLVERGISCGES